MLSLTVNNTTTVRLALVYSTTFNSALCESAGYLLLSSTYVLMLGDMHVWLDNHTNPIVDNLTKIMNGMV